jgi:hypothetical protein
MSYKTLQDSDVEAAMDELLVANGKVTSLEVKENLRSKGFWATQAIVGVAVRGIAFAKSLEWEADNAFMTYYPQGGLNGSSTVPAGITPLAAPAQKPQKQPVDPQDREPIDVPDSGDWIVTNEIGNNPLYFKGTLKPEQARYAYTLQTGIDYVHVRSKRF